MKASDFSQSKWENLYRSYKERYNKQSSKTPMEQVHNLNEFKAYFVQLTNESPDAGVSKTLNSIVQGQRNILSRKQNMALLTNLEKFGQDTPAEVQEFLKSSGYYSADTVKKRNEWAIAYGASFAALLEEIELDTWANYFNS